MPQEKEPLKIEFGGITANNVEMLRKLNTVCFPIAYSDNFYKDVVARKNEGLNKFAYFGGFVIGAVCARVEDKRLYIMTLGVLAAYRGRQVGATLIQSILDYYEENKNVELAEVEEIALHVHVSNQDAIRFYVSKFGFEQGEKVENYYRRVEPPHGYLLFKKLS